MDTFKADPLEYFPYEITEKILSYLPAKDLMGASAFNSSWYDFIGQSKNFMKNVKIKMRGKDCIEQITNPVMASTRNYDTLEIDTVVIGECMTVIFEQLKSRPWSNIIIKNVCFRNPEQAKIFFSLIKENVKSLEMSGAFVLSTGEKTQELPFPNLTKVVVKNTISSGLFLEMFQNLQQLTQLDLMLNGLNLVGVKTVKNLLMKNEKLEVLNITSVVLNQILFEDKIAVPFKLKKLSILNGKYQKDENSKKYYTNLIAFLQQQSESLETIIFDEWLGEDVLKAVFTLRKLKNLTINGFSKIDATVDYNNLVLTKNISIKKLSIEVVPEYFSILKAMVVATPNLNLLSTSLINDEFMDFINRNLPKLQKLSTNYLDIKSIPQSDALKNLKHLDVKDCCQCLRKSVLTKKFYDLNDFEQLLFYIVIDQNSSLFQ